jgi:hypothetical protein
LRESIASIIVWQPEFRHPILKGYDIEYAFNKVFSGLEHLASSVSRDSDKALLMAVRARVEVSYKSFKGGDPKSGRQAI